MSEAFGVTNTKGTVAETIEQTLELVAAKVGDPSDRIYARLFQAYPQFEALFALDTDGGVRAQMLETSFDCILGAAVGSRTADLLLEAARLQHAEYGIGDTDIHVMFEVMRDEFRDIAGTDWTEAVERDWAHLLEDLSRMGR